MAASTGLPVFAYIEERQQAKDLRDFLRKLSKEDGRIPENSEPEMADEVLFLVRNCGILGASMEANDLPAPLNSLVSLIVPLETTRVGDVVREFCERLCGAEFEGARAGAALRVLSNLFYGFGNHEIKQQALQYDIYCAMVRVGGKSGQMGDIPHDPETLRGWFKSWDLHEDTNAKRNLLRLVHEGLSKSAAGTDAQSAIMIELLRTYTTEAEAAVAVGDARECVRGAMADTATFLFDHLLALQPVRALEKGDPLTHHLLQICVSGSVEDYLKFYETSGAHVRDALKLDHAAMTYKMRILSLMSLGEEKQEIALEDLSKVLKLPLGEELEEFVIEAIQAGAVKVCYHVQSWKFQARIDQVGGRILILGVKHRRFERGQWEQLKAKLDAWELNLTLAKRHLDTVVVH